MNIKKVSEITGISADTIRYYERIGIIPPVTRSSNGIRDFSDDDIRWLEFSKRFRNAGMSIEKLVEYIRLFSEGDSTIPARIDLLTEEYDRLVEKRDEIQDHLNRLEFKINNYQEKLVPYEKSLKKFDSEGE